LLVVFYVLDSWLYRTDAALPVQAEPTPDSRMSIRGVGNIGWLVLVVCTIALTGLWKTSEVLPILGVDLPVQDAVRCVVMGLICGVSYWLTPKELYEANQFSWEPVLEVARLFFGIFVTMAPVLLMLRVGTAGVFAPLVELVTNAQGQPVNAMYFWMTGVLSSFLDNAPTYLVFFNLAGGDARHLMHDAAPTLTAISAGAVFMGANTYIGNAPNFMVKAIAQSRGVPMPGFFAYVAWSGAVLLPLFAIMTWLFF
jgi:Na+/H+ antiporter NhaD/arsenite permease-like protein